MQYMGLNEIREKYLSFFESKGHLSLPSFPLIPQNDKSILLINAGMTPLKPFFTGQQKPPRSRITTCQKCIRTPDIERVGKTSRHGTFFEMLGNFSFGDYFKHEATAWAWEFLTKVLMLPVDKLYVTVYTEDDEAYDIWTKEVGVDPSHVSRLGKADNFWEIGSGPCGPCSEIYFDRGPDKGCGSPDCRVGCDCDRYVEFWNLVFTQFDSDGKGNYSKLDKCNIDTGMGLERIACIMQGVDSLFDVDTIKNVTARLSEMSSRKYGESHENDVSLRVVTDHIRSTTFMVCDGVLPSNEGRGYVLRRLLRRAARHGKLLGIKSDHFLGELVDVVIRESEKAYPELREKASYIKRVIEQEEDRFNQTIDQGLVILSEIIETSKKNNSKVLDGNDTFKLYDTFGFPLDLTKEIAEENGLTVDEKRFNELMNGQKTKARNAVKGHIEYAWKENEILQGLPATVFTGYNTLEQNNCEVLAVIKDGELVGNARQSDKITIILNTTSFYGESGGQVGDKGILKNDSVKIKVSDCRKINGINLHIAEIENGVLNIGDNLTASVDSSIRNATMRNHSSAHLLQTALRKILGDHISQAGSYVDDKRMRFDFTHFEAISKGNLTEIENSVNEYVLSLSDVVIRELPIEEAKKEGAIALFGEKYGDTVRVVKMGDISTEFCGGTHVKNTAQIGLFKIVSETGIAAGVRRIEAITGINILEYTADKEKEIAAVASVLKTGEKEVLTKTESIVAENKNLQKQIDLLNDKLAASKLDDILAKAEKIGDINIITARYDAKTDVLRNMCDTVRDKYGDTLILLVGVDGDKVNIAAGAGENAISKGAHAGNLVKIAAQVMGGGGGGRPDSATAGGKDASKIEEAFAAVKKAIIKQ